MFIMQVHLVKEKQTLPFINVGVSKSFWNEINTFIQQEPIQLIKSDDKVIIYCFTHFLFQINAVLLNFEFIKESWFPV